MAFPRVNTAGWSVGEQLTSAQVNALDVNVSHTIDRRGDTCTPVTPLIINGAGLSIGGDGLACSAIADFTGLITCNDISASGGAQFQGLTVVANATVGGSLGVTDYVTIAGALDVAGEALFNADVGIGDNSANQCTVRAESFFLAPANFLQNATFGNGADFDAGFVASQGTFTGNVEVGPLGAVSVGGGAAIGGVLNVTGVVTISSPMAFASVGRVPRKFALGTDANVVITPGVADGYLWPTGVLTASRGVDLNGGSEGDFIELANHDAVYTITVRNGIGGPTLTSGVLAYGRCALFVRLGSTWRLFRINENI